MDGLVEDACYIRLSNFISASVQKMESSIACDLVARTSAFVFEHLCGERGKEGEW